jgi:hypothetical protein
MEKLSRSDMIQRVKEIAMTFKDLDDKDIAIIIKNAYEIHVIDSSWAAFIYLLDCKYRLFKDKRIYLYPLRNYKKMFQDPIQLDNWVFM